MARAKYKLIELSNKARNVEDLTADAIKSIEGSHKYTAFFRNKGAIRMYGDHQGIVIAVGNNEDEHTKGMIEIYGSDSVADYIKMSGTILKDVLRKRKVGLENIAEDLSQNIGRDVQYG